MLWAMNDKTFRLAIQTAKGSPSKKQVGAVLLSKGKVISTACNLEDKTHPVQARWARKAGLDPKQYLHAEIAALVRCRRPVDSIVVARVNSEGKLRNSRPCCLCQLGLRDAGIKQMFYSTNEGFICEKL